MSEEERKDAPVEKPIDDDEFLDEHPIEKKVEEPVEEPKVEEKTPEPEPEKPAEPARPRQDHYDYDDPRLAAIEDARIRWNKSYRKMSMIKTFVAIGSLAVIILGWIIPTVTMKDAGALPLYIALGIALVGISAVLVFSLIQRKKDKQFVGEYFQAYYNNINEYAFDGLGIENIQGDYTNKVTDDEVNACGLYPGANSIGSRESITFTYKNMDCALADMAIQKSGTKGLATVFVGKYLRTHNSLEFPAEGRLMLYFKGNDRAIPPLAIEGLSPIEEKSKFAVYGPATLKKVLTHKIKTALNQIHTDSLLVDVAITIESGRTYWCLGYEDDLMVLPSKEPFDPHYVQGYKAQIQQILNIALLMNEKE